MIFDPDIFGANRPGILGGYTHVVWLGMLSGSWEENSPNHFVANLRVTRLCTGSATEAQHAILASQCHDPQYGLQFEERTGNKLSRPLFSARCSRGRSCPSFVKHSHLFADPMSCGHLFQETGFSRVGWNGRSSTKHGAR